MIRKSALTVAAIALTAVFCGTLARVIAMSEAQATDPAAYYKSKCLMCHGKKAEKKFDTSLSDDQLVDIVLKGKKVEKPPHMPGYAEKGVTAEQARALVAYMKELKATP